MSARERKERAVRQLTQKLQRGHAIDRGAMSAAAMKAFGGAEGLMNFICDIAKNAEEGSIAQVTALRFIVEITKPQFQNDQELLKDTDTQDLEALLVDLLMKDADQGGGDDAAPSTA